MSSIKQTEHLNHCLVTLCLLPESVFIHPSPRDLPGLVQPIKTALLSVNVAHSSRGCASLLRTVLAPSESDLTSPNCMAMKPYHSVQISIPPLGEILFQAITLHQRDVIPTLCSYCPPWNRVFSCAPWDNGIRDVHAAELPSRSHKGPRAMIEILNWCLHRNVIIILGTEMHQALFTWWDDHMPKWNGVAYKVLMRKLGVMIHWDTLILPTVCVEYAQLQYDWRGTNDPCPLPIHLRCSLCVRNATNYSPGGFTLL